METEFNRALRHFVKGEQTIPMQLAKVTGAEIDTIAVVTINDDELFDVRLQAIADGNTEGVLLKPKIGSWVLIGDIGNGKHDYIVIAYEALETATIKIGTTQLKIDNTGIEIKRGTESFKTVLNDVLDKIKTLKILTTTGIATVAPVDVPLIEVLKTRLNQILK